jgi:ribosomal protein L11 methyltransferase
MSDTRYIEYNFILQPRQPASDILMAELGELSFESFVEGDNGIMAYIKKEDWNPDMLETVGILHNPEFQISWSHAEVEPQNWNAAWEKDFNPIQLGTRCVVRAPFHSPSSAEFDIVIAPKMSFGTGHHETTQLMMQHLLNQDLGGQSVLDMGCGTGVLAILAAMKGALHIRCGQDT